MDHHKEEKNAELELDHQLIETTHKVEHFYHNYKQQIYIVVIIAAVALIGYTGFKMYYLEPKEKEAQAAMFQAQNWFAVDSFDLALKGKGDVSGFETIADEYGLTKAGNLAHYYAGICYMRKGEFQNALDQLEDFSSSNKMVSPLAEGLKGDAYVELNELEKGAKHYMKAANMSKNKLTSPMFLKKAGMVFEELKEYGDAIDAYEKIKKDFSDASEAQDIDKYIARANAAKTNG